jgi:hypothetical protein
VTILTSNVSESQTVPFRTLAVEGVAMETLTGISLADVQAVYDGAEGDLWELVMGEQIHIGGFVSSMDLAEQAGIGPGVSGVDLCCWNGAGMRFPGPLPKCRPHDGRRRDADGA